MNWSFGLLVCCWTWLTGLAAGRGHVRAPTRAPAGSDTAGPGLLDLDLLTPLLEVPLMGPLLFDLDLLT